MGGFFQRGTMKEFNTEQQDIIRKLGLAFDFSRNIKYSNEPFANAKKALQADKLVESAQALGDIVLKYHHGVVPNDANENNRALYEYNGRALTLTDEAANWLAKNK